MGLATVAFNQILTLVLLMGVGVGCSKLNWIDNETNKKLSTVLLMLVNPVVIFLSYQRDFDVDLLVGLAIAFGLSMVSFVVSIVASELIYRKKGSRDFSIEKFSLVYTNTGFLGIPLVYGVFGSEGVFYLTAYLTAFFIFFWTHGMILMSGKKDIKAIKKAVVSPPMWAIYLGFALFLLQIQLSEQLYHPMRLLGNLNTPLAMLVAGASLARTQVNKVLSDKRLYLITFLKLLCLPVFKIVLFSSLNVPPLVFGTIIVLAACPVAVNIILFAYRYDKDHVFASESFAVTTILSLFTIPLLLGFI